MRAVYNIHGNLKSDIFKINPEPITVYDFDEASLKKFAAQFDNIVSAGYPFVPIYIDSFGGGI